MMEKPSEGKEKELVTEPEKGEDKDIQKEYKHCGNHPCVGIKLEPMLTSILQTYGEWKSNKQVRFHMYSDAVEHIYGTGLGKGVRKRLPNCVAQIIREMCPDKEYTGFIPSKCDK